MTGLPNSPAVGDLTTFAQRKLMWNGAGWEALLSGLGPVIGVQIFGPGSGTYTPTAGTVAALGIAQAAGGGGGGVGTTSGIGSAAGGGVGETRAFVVNPVVGSYPYSVGAKGTGAGASNSTGNTGGDTTFGSAGAICTAKGGTGGGGSTGSGWGAAGTTPTGSGGIVIPPNFPNPVNGDYIYGGPGRGGGSLFGGSQCNNNAFLGRASAGNTGYAGTNYAVGPGAGGVGGAHGNTSTTAFAGGDGGDGLLLIIEYGAPYVGIQSNLRTTLVADKTLYVRTTQRAATVSTTTNLFTLAGHGFVLNQPLVFNSTGTLPTGCTKGLVYYARDILTDTFGIATTQGGGQIDLTGTPSGTHYVQTGNDTGADGSAADYAHAFLTLQAAIDYALKTFDWNQHVLTIQLADGFYRLPSGTEAVGYVGSACFGAKDPSSFVIQGNIATPDNCVIGVNASSGTGLQGDESGTQFTVTGMRVERIGSTTGQWGVFAIGGANVIVTNMSFGNLSGGCPIGAAYNGTVNCIGTNYLKGNCSDPMLAYEFGYISCEDWVISSGLTCDEWACAFRYGIVNCDQLTYTQNGTAITGADYNYSTGGMIGTAVSMPCNPGGTSSVDVGSLGGSGWEW